MPYAALFIAVRGRVLLYIYGRVWYNGGVRERVKHVRKHLGNGFQIVLVGALTGTFAGVVVTLYTVLAAMAEDFSRGYYAFFRA